MSLISRTAAPLRSVYLRSTPAAALRHTRAAIFRPTPTPRRTMAEQIFAKDAAPRRFPTSIARIVLVLYREGTLATDPLMCPCSRWPLRMSLKPPPRPLTSVV